MSQAGYDDSQLAAQIQLNGATYMIPAVNFVYPVFVNLTCSPRLASRIRLLRAASSLPLPSS